MSLEENNATLCLASKKLAVVWNKNYQENLDSWHLEQSQIAFAIKKVKREIVESKNMLLDIKKTYRTGNWKNFHDTCEDMIWEHKLMAQDIRLFVEPFWRPIFNEEKKFLILNAKNDFNFLIQKYHSGLKRNNRNIFKETVFKVNKIIEDLKCIDINTTHRLFKLYGKEPILPDEKWAIKNDGNDTYNTDNDFNFSKQCSPNGLSYQRIVEEESKNKRIEYKSISLSVVEGVSEHSFLTEHHKDKLKLIENLDINNIDFIGHYRTHICEKEFIIGLLSRENIENENLIENFQDKLKEFVSEENSLFV